MDGDRAECVGRTMAVPGTRPVGSLVGHCRLTAHGGTDRAEGRVRDAVGGLRGSLRDSQR
jgi:hypothetical protein